MTTQNGQSVQSAAGLWHQMKRSIERWPDAGFSLDAEAYATLAKEREELLSICTELCVRTVSGDVSDDLRARARKALGLPPVGDSQ